MNVATKEYKEYIAKKTFECVQRETMKFCKKGGKSAC